jgi:hypothetical protein
MLGVPSQFSLLCGVVTSKASSGSSATQNWMLLGHIYEVNIGWVKKVVNSQFENLEG